MMGDMSVDDDILLERTEDLRHGIVEDEDMATVSNASTILRTRDDGDTIHMSTEDGGDTRSVLLAAGGTDAGGFIVGGSINRSQHVNTYDLDEDEDRHTVVLSGDEDDEDGMEGGGGGGGEERGLLGDDEVAVVTIRPLSKSRLLPPRPPEELDQSTQVVGEERSEVNIEERTGYVKEYIEDGLGMVFSMECGLVLFHLRNVYHQGFWIGENYADYLHKFPPGTEITFLDSYHEGDEFKAISQEGFIRQATALWVNERPKHLLKSLHSAEQRNSMRQEREALLGYVKNDFFLRMAQVRGRGQITGYLTDDLGLIESADKAIGNDGEWPEENVTMILFHVDDLFMFGRRWRESNRREPVQQAFPPGLRICFDARSIRRFRGVTGQAAAVFAGSWPAVPHPTALPGGVGSNAPCHECPAGQTFYYLNASLREDLDMKLEEFKRRADHGTDLQNAELTIESSQDYYAWRDAFAPPGRRGPRPRRQGDNEDGKKRNYHQFKRLPPTGSDKSKEKKGIKLENDPVIKLEPLNYALKQEPNY